MEDPSAELGPQSSVIDDLEPSPLLSVLNDTSAEAPLEDLLNQASLESEESLGELPAMAAPKSHAYVMGNKGREGARETAFYQVLNVSEGWHRNRMLSKKEDQKLLYTKELLAERLDGRVVVAVEFYGDEDNTSFRVNVGVKDNVSVLLERVCEHIEAEGRDIELLVEGKRLNLQDSVEEAFRKAYARKPMSFPKPYIGLVWACPR